MFEGFHQSRSRDRTSHEGHTNGLKPFGRKRLGSQPRPEAVTVTSDCGEAGDAMLADEIVNLTSLDVHAAEIASAETCVSGAGPRLSYA